MATNSLRYTGTVQDSSGDYESYRDGKQKEHLIAPATGKEKGAAGAGRGFVNPKTAEPSLSVGQQQAVDEARDENARAKIKAMGFKKGGRIDGIAQRGFTKGKMR